ncbi:wiskott-Aldrich syndrome protein family member 3-like [Spodoptera litura]|uniref:Wiskott-Aldrich syndrome protein family member 3-like n=1 Tax=Spodoptera litura TaxID=69820 RepID=A0A9J7DVN1_SPOLT|nr:wiskott-Aldrich syndrome protein family member 3-like [Spodoptera litura]
MTENEPARSFELGDDSDNMSEVENAKEQSPGASDAAGSSQSTPPPPQPPPPPAPDAEAGNIFDEILQYFAKQYPAQRFPPDVARLVDRCRQEASRLVASANAQSTGSSYVAGSNQNDAVQGSSPPPPPPLPPPPQARPLPPPLERMRLITASPPLHAKQPSVYESSEISLRKLLRNREKTRGMPPVTGDDLTLVELSKFLYELEKVKLYHESEIQRLLEVGRLQHVHQYTVLLEQSLRTILGNVHEARMRRPNQESGMRRLEFVREYFELLHQLNTVTQRITAEIAQYRQ